MAQAFDGQYFFMKKSDVIVNKPITPDHPIYEIMMQLFEEDNSWGDSTLTH